MSFLSFINQFYGKKESQINSFNLLSDDAIKAKYAQGKNNKTTASMFLKNFDLNNDGKLDNGEISKLKKISAFIKSDDFDMKKIDSDNNGRFSEEELNAFIKKQPKQTNEINKLNNATTDVISKQFAENKSKNTKLSVFMNAFDRNKDGVLDEKETKDMQLVAKYLQTDDDFDMNQLDTDKDGKISKEEMKLFYMAKSFDADNNGKLNEEESTNLKLAIQFDENKDGILSEKESKNMLIAKNADTDKNGILSDEEKTNFEKAQQLQEQIHQEISNAGIAPNISNNSSLPAGHNGYVQGNYQSDLEKLKSEPTISQKIKTGEIEIKKLENTIQDIKNNAQKEIDAKEQNVKNMEKTLLEAKEDDSEDIKNLKDGIHQKSLEIIEKETELRAKENEIFNLKSTISVDKILLAGFEKELAALSTTTKSDKINQRNAARKAQLETQIKDLKDKIAANEKKLEDTTTQRDNLKNTIIPKLKEERSALEDSLAKTDDSYKENVKALKEARTAFEETKTDIQAKTKKQIEKLETELETKKAEQLKLNETHGSIKGKSGQIGSVIDSMMAKDGVLAGKGDMIAQIAEECGVPVDLFVAIISSETGRGTSSAIRTKNNPGGIMDKNTNWMTVKKFETLEDGLRAMANTLRKNYINKGLTTPQTIGPKYCPVGAKNDPSGKNKYWIPTVKNIISEFNAKLT